MTTDMIRADITVQANIEGRHAVAIVGVIVIGCCFIGVCAMQHGYGMKCGSALFTPANSMPHLSD